MHKAILPLVVLAISFQGCSADTAAQVAVNALQASVNVATAEGASIPAADLPAYKNYVGALQGLTTQLASCNASVSKVSLSKSNKFLACFNAFVAGATNPQELTALRVLSPSTQAKVQSVLAAVIIGLNAAIPAFGGSVLTTPVVSADNSINTDVFVRTIRAMERAGALGE